MILKLFVKKMISNATPLICLAKINQLEILKKLFNKIFITDVIKKGLLFRGNQDLQS